MAGASGVFGGGTPTGGGQPQQSSGGGNSISDGSPQENTNPAVEGGQATLGQYDDGTKPESPENPELSDREYSAEDLNADEMEKDEFADAFSTLSAEEQAEVLYDTMGEGSAGGSYARAGLAGLTTGATATGAGIAATVLTGWNPIAGAVAAGVAATGGKLAEQYALNHLGDEAEQLGEYASQRFHESNFVQSYTTAEEHTYEQTVGEGGNDADVTGDVSGDLKSDADDEFDEKLDEFEENEHSGTDDENTDEEIA